MSTGTGWIPTLAVAAGAALGAVARWRVGIALAPATVAFPLGTLVVNVLGGFLIGVAMVILARGSLAHVLLVTGVLGGFTTFSAFSAESLTLLQRGQVVTAAVHAGVHVAGSLVAAWGGMALARALVR